MRAVAVCLPCLALCLSLAPPAAAQEWTRFRGPNGSGVSEADTIPISWTEDDYNWKAALPGEGHSSPVLWGDKVFLLSADRQTATRYVLCLSAADGKEIWRETFPSIPHNLHARSSYASSTPAVDEDHVYVAWSSPESTDLLAFDHDGTLVWREDLGPWVGSHGFGTSPIVYGDLVILHNSQQASQLAEGVAPGESFVAAIDRVRGGLQWRTDLKGARVCYSVPFIYRPPGGPDELICTCTGNGVFSLNPNNGEWNWSVEDAFDKRTVSSPIEASGMIFGSTGSGGGGNYVVAIEPAENAKMAYKLPSSGRFKAPYVPTAIADGDAVYLLYDDGFAACVDAPTGKIRWTKPRTGAMLSGSPIRVRDRIYFMDVEGVAWVLAADPDQYRLLAKNPLGEPSRSTPAVSGGKLFLRTYSHLICVGGQPAPP